MSSHSEESKREQLTKLQPQLADLDYIRLTVCDIHGISRGKLLPARNAEKFLRKGMGAFAGLGNINPRSSELQRVKQLDVMQTQQRGGNLVMHPDLTTFRITPWAGVGKYKVGEVLCELSFTNGQPDGTCARYLARQQLDRLKQHGYTFLSGIEMEFIVTQNSAPVYLGADFYTNLLLSRNMEFLGAAEKQLAQAHINLEDLHVEPASGQFELNYQPTWGILGGDWPFLIREALKEVAASQGKEANFMSRFTSESGDTKFHCGNGAHFNHSLWDASSTTNLMFDSNDPNHVSELAMRWLAGLMTHLPALTALYCPTVNCYKRMAGAWAPSTASWGFDNRFTSIRVKNFGKTSTYIENRIPSGLANPYLVMAATIAAGLDGIEKRLEVPVQAGIDGTETLPRSLPEALDNLRKDEVLRAALGEGFVDWFCALKEEGEIEILKDMQDGEEAELKRHYDMYAVFS